MSETKAPKVWIVRAGKHGEDEETALSEGLAIVGFGDFDDLSGYPTRSAMVESYLKKKPSAPPNRAENYARQLWSLREDIAVGDVAVMPLKTRPGQVALGTFSGPYKFAMVNGQKRHTRQVKWTHPDVPRSTFRQDLLHSFGAFLTVCRVKRHDAATRVQSVLKGTGDPGTPPGDNAIADTDEETMESRAGTDLAQGASDEITAFIRSKFPGHEMARLVEAVLHAEGLKTQRAAPGPDGGADILAGGGPLGLDPPFLCVQVKATESPADVKIFRELAGTMAAFKATQGLLVSWGGFKQSVIREGRQETFKIRLWDQNDLVQAIYRSYEKLPDEIQAELPLKRVWMLVRESAETNE